MTVLSLAASRPAVGNEVRQRMQPMNFDDLLDKYLPQLPGLDDAPPPGFNITSDHFKSVNVATSEKMMYAPLRDVLDEVLTAMGGKKNPLLRFRVTNNMTQRRDRIAEELPILAPDVSAYSPSVLGNPESISWRTIDLAIEVKLNLSADPVGELDSDESQDRNRVQSLTRDSSMSQIADYARCMTYANARTRVFILGIFAKTARIFVYDRAATVFSEAFDYNQHPDLLGRFLHRFSIADNASRGFDPTVTQSLSLAERRRLQKAIRTWNALRDSVQTKHKVNIPEIRGTPCRITVPNDGQEFVYLTLGGPVFSSIGLFSRGTRCWLAFDAQEDLKPDASNAVLIKDSWVQDGRIPERDYYEHIQRSGELEGIAQLKFSADFDMNAHSTINHEAAGVIARRHVRTILGTIGRRLSQFESTKELTEGILSAVKGHRNALNNGVLHRDISEQNVLLPLIPGQGSGFIIDFDLSLFTDPEKRRHVEGWDLTGTVQFMAIVRLEDATIEHKSWHDLESFFWVFLYTVARHTRNSWNEGDETKEDVINIFDSAPRSLVRLRRDFLQSPRRFKVHGHSPLTTCIHRLARMLSNAYPTDKETEKGILPEYPTHENFCDILFEQLRDNVWPDDPSIPWERPRFFNGIIQPTSSRAYLQSPFVGSEGSTTRKRGYESESSQATSSKKPRTGGVL